MSEITVTVNGQEWEMFQKWRDSRKTKFQKLDKQQFLNELLRKMDLNIVEDEDMNSSSLEEIVQNYSYDIFSQMKERPNVKFDLENFDCVNDWSHVEVGWNDEGWLSFMAGGDWEIPVFGIIYFTGKEFKCYIPKNGNCFNKETMEAWGNGDNDDKIIDKIDPEISYDICLLNADIRFFLNIISKIEE